MAAHHARTAMLAALFALAVPSTSLSASSSSTLPQVGKVRAKFDSMIGECNLPPATIEFIDSPQQRLLFKGASAAADNPMIREAFAIVYEDMGPIRIAGDLIYNSLVGVAADAKVAAGSEPLLASDDDDDAGNVAATLATSRRLFDLIDADSSGALDREELLRSPELVEYIIRDGEDPEAAVDRFIAAADDNGDGVISFVEFAAAAAVDPTLSAMDETLTAALARAPRDAPVSESRGRFGRKPPGERFDSMRMTCLEWEAALGCSPPPGEDDDFDEAEECDLEVLEAQEALVDGRLLVVLRGGWEIARCEPVTDALRYAYLEYSSLRLGGDLIFKVLSKVVDGKAKAASSSSSSS